VTRSPSTRRSSITGDLPFTLALPIGTPLTSAAPPGFLSRVFAAIASGCVAGVLGLTGLLGFFVFFVTSLLLSAGLYLKVGCEPTPYFRQSSDVWFEGVMQAMLSYIFFWTLFYDIVHVY